MLKAKLLGEKKLGNWSLAKDLENARYFFTQTNVSFTPSILSSDFVFSPWHALLLENKLFSKLVWAKKIRKIRVITVLSNETIIREKHKLRKLDKIVDIFIIPSKKAQLRIKKSLPYTNTYYLPFYVDGEVFSPKNKNKSEICALLKLDFSAFKNKIIIGSFQRDSLGEDLNFPKWQKNPDLLLKILKALPKSDFILLLAGPRRHYIIRECKKHGIPFIFYGDMNPIEANVDDLEINNLPSKVVSLLYNLTDIYIVTSKSEGGPKAILEAALTKTFLFSTNVGLAPDFLHNDLIFNNEKEILGLINNFSNQPNLQNYIEYNYKKVKDVITKTRMLDKYRKLISLCLK